MTKEETRGMLNMLNASYPNATRNMNMDERKAQLIMWYGAFQNVESSVMQKAVEKHIGSKVYFPTIAEIRENVRSMLHADPVALYDVLVKQARMSLQTTAELIEKGYGGKADTYRTQTRKREAYAGLPDELKVYVKSTEGLVLWAKLHIGDENEKKVFLTRVKEIQASMDSLKRLEA